MSVAVETPAPVQSASAGEPQQLTPLRDAKRFTFGLTISLGLTFIRSLFVFHVLGPSLMGAWKAAAVVDTVHESARMGVLRAMSIRVPVLDGAGLKREANEVIADSGSVMLWLGVLLASVFFAVSFCLGNPDLRLAMRWMAALALVTEPYVFLRDLAVTRHRFDLRSNETILRSVVECSAAIALCYFLKLSGLGGGTVASVAITGVYLYKRQIVPIRLKPNFHAIKELMFAGAPFSLSEAAYELLRRLDLVVMTAVLGTTAAGYYGISRLITDFTVVLCQKGIAQVLSPHLLHTYGRTQSVAKAARYFEVPARLFCYAGPPLIIAGTILVRDFVWLFLPQYKPGIPAAQITMWTIFLVALHSSVSSFAVAAGIVPGLLRVYACLIPVGALAQFAILRMGAGLEGAAWCSLGLLTIAGATEIVIAKARCGNTVAESLRFIASLYFPAAYALVFTLAIDHMHIHTGFAGYAGHATEAAVKILLVLTAYLPILGIYERKFSLLRTIRNAR
jgi:O-antigen/teichoic acid export membrane protein